MTKTSTPSPLLMTTSSSLTSLPPASASADNASLGGGEQQQDHRLRHVWFSQPGGRWWDRGEVLTAEGVDNIANHKYQAGDYTALDRLLNPIWTRMTEGLLPMWLAPNLVTTIGGCFCLVSWLLSTHYLRAAADDDDDDDGVVAVIPRWLYVWNGAALIAYYTLDCMDGKQARRTNSSSPLGQLFDHGMDGLCNVSHAQAIQCIVQVPPALLMLLQCTLQCAFFQAQWEEYYTGRLPHATGDYCGVTEVLYGMAGWSLLTGALGRGGYDTEVWRWADEGDDEGDNGGTAAAAASWAVSWITGGTGVVQVRHVASLGWVVLMGGLVALSLGRVFRHVNNPGVFASAVSKLLFGPWLLTAVGMWTALDGHFGGPQRLQGHIRHLPPISLHALGMAFVLLTVRIIVYSMARMAYASIQVDVVGFLAVYVVLRDRRCWWQSAVTAETTTTTITPADLSGPFSFFWQWDRNSILSATMEAYFVASLVRFSYCAISQLCRRLQIKLFRIPHNNNTGSTGSSGGGGGGTIVPPPPHGKKEK